MSKKFAITIGADPEFFVGDKNETPVMACGRFGGKKGAPVLLGEDGGFLEDGTAIEFNLAAAPTLKEMKDKIFKLVHEFELKQQVKVSYYSSQSWPMDELKKHSEAMTIGCAPDRYAYGLRTLPSVSQFKNRRFAGGHIHVGIDPWPEGLLKSNLIKYLDVCCLTPWVGYFGDSHRFTHYGHPGLYRETSYGIEWRSPDNFWCNPTWWGSADRNRLSAAREFIRAFDNSIDLLSKVLEHQGHGAAINSIIQDKFDEEQLDAMFSAPHNRSKINLPARCRTMGGTITAAMTNLLPRKEKSKGKKDSITIPIFEPFAPLDAVVVSEDVPDFG